MIIKSAVNNNTDPDQLMNYILSLFRRMLIFPVDISFCICIPVPNTCNDIEIVTHASISPHVLVTFFISTNYVMLGCKYCIPFIHHSFLDFFLKWDITIFYEAE